MGFGGSIVRALFFYICVQLGLGWSADDLASDNGTTRIFAVAVTVFGVGVTSALTWREQRKSAGPEEPSFSEPSATHTPRTLLA